MANDGHGGDHDGTIKRGDESVMWCCWYISFPDGNGASYDAENARHSGFSSLAWRTVQPAEDPSSFQWRGYTFSCSKMVPVPLEILPLMVRLHFFLPFNSAALPEILLSMVWLHLFTLQKMILLFFLNSPWSPHHLSFPLYLFKVCPLPLNTIPLSVYIHVA